MVRCRRYIPPAQKELLVQMHLQGLDTRQISDATGYQQRVIQRTLQKWREKLRVFELDKGGRRRVLNWVDLAYLEELIEDTPDLYLSELRAMLWEHRGVDVCEQTIRRSLKRRGYTYKKVSRMAKERSAEKRADYMYNISGIPPEALVFVDEAACNRHTGRRQYGWAPRGDRARRHDYFVRGTRYSVLPAISLRGVLHLDILTCAWNAEEFRGFVKALLTRMRPYPAENSVLVMDNASVHHFEGLREMVEAQGCKLIYLPPYSPDLNPIEEGFSAMKSWIRREREYALHEMSGGDACDPYGMLWEAVYESMTPTNIRGWFRDCGYVVD